MNPVNFQYLQVPLIFQSIQESHELISEGVQNVLILMGNSKVVENCISELCTGLSADIKFFNISRNST